MSQVPYESLLVPMDISRQMDMFLVTRAERLQAMVLDGIGLPDMYDDENAQQWSKH